MDKRWLSRLLNDAAFPALALAVAVSQVKVGAHKETNLLRNENQPSELQFDGRLQQNSGDRDSSTPSGSPRAAERPAWNQDAVRKK